MATKIEWAEETWNPITGCTPISEGCKNCYAKRTAENRLRGRFGYDQDDPFKITLHANRMTQPLHWRKGRVVFVCSMGDLFHEEVNPSWIHRACEIMRRTPQHTYMILTKRPEAMKLYIENSSIRYAPNVWLGVTAENQDRWDERVLHLLSIEAAGKRFVSVEPMLTGVQLNGLWPDLVICGAETGTKARQMDPYWAIGLKNNCWSHDIPFFFKKASQPHHVDQYQLNVREWPE